MKFNRHVVFSEPEKAIYIEIYTNTHTYIHISIAPVTCLCANN